MSVPPSELGPPTLFSASECVLPLEPKVGEGQHSNAGEGLGGVEDPKRTTGKKPCTLSTLYYGRSKLKCLSVRLYTVRTRSYFLRILFHSGTYELLPVKSYPWMCKVQIRVRSKAGHGQIDPVLATVK